MPSVSKKQRNLMAAAAHNPSFAKKVGVPTSVAKEFNAADKGKKFAKGGETMEKAKEMRHARTLSKLAKEEREEAMKMKKGGCVKKAAGGKLFAGKESKAEEAKEKKRFGTGAAYKKAEAKFEGEKYARGGGIEVRGKTKGTMVKMCGGGMTKKGK